MIIFETSRPIWLALGSLALALSFTCQTANSQDASLLYEQAKKEGRVLWYCGEIQEVCQKATQAFMKKYPGIEADVIRLGGGDMSARYTTEKKSGAPTADLLMITDFLFVKTGMKDGLLASYRDSGIPGYDAYPKKWILEDIGTPFELSCYGIGFNTDKMSVADSPKTYKDLLDPKYKGMIGAPDPRENSTANIVYWRMVGETLGNNYLQALAKQDVHWVKGGLVPTTAMLGAGEFSIQAQTHTATLENLKAKGAPVEFIKPELLAGNSFMWVLNSSPTHPATAKLLGSFLISQEGQAQYLPTGSYGAFTNSDVPIVAPDSKYATREELDKTLTMMGLK